MKRALSMILVLAMVVSCLAMLQFNTLAAEEEAYVGRTFEFTEDVSSAWIRTSTNKMNFGTLADGSYTLSYYVYNLSATPIKIQLFMQDNWDYYASSGSSVLVPASSGRLLTYNYTVENGLIYGTGQPSNATLRIEFDPGDTGLNVIPGGTKILIKYNSVDGSDPVKQLSQSSTAFNKEEVTKLPTVGVQVGTNINGTSYMYHRANADMTEFVDGTHAVQYYVYNPNSYPVKVKFYMQHGWDDVNGNAGTTKTIQPGKKELLTYRYTVKNGIYHADNIDPTKMMVRFDVFHDSGTTPAGTNIYIEYAGDYQTDPINDLGVTLYNMTITANDKFTKTQAICPDYDIDYLSVTNGDVEEGKTKWSTWNGGSIALSTDTPSGEGQSIYYTPEAGKKYGTVTFNVTAAVLKSDEKNCDGHGAGRYRLTFDAKATKEFKTGVTIASLAHLTAANVAEAIGGAAGDYTSTWTTHSETQTFTTEWQTYTLEFNIIEKRYNTYVALYNNGVKNAYDFVLRFDASSTGYASEQTTGYYIDNVVLEPLSTTPTGVVLQGSKPVGQAVNAPYLLLGYNNNNGGVFSEKDIVDGKLVFKQYVFNETNSEVSFTPKFQVFTGSAWSGPSFSDVTIPRNSGAWLKMEAELDDENKLVVGGKQYDVSKVFLRFNFIGDVDDTVKLVLTAPEGYHSLLTSKSGSAFNVSLAYETKYNTYPDDVPKEEVDADFHISTAFGDHMVLQRDKEIKIWGTSAYIGKDVTVSFKDQVKTTVVQEDGTWSVTLDKETASTVGADLTATCGDKTHRLQDILMGDVYFVGGQSNAEKTLLSCGNVYSNDYKEGLVASANGHIRLFRQTKTTATNVPGSMTAPQEEPVGGNVWAIETPYTANVFSAIGIFFAHRVYDATRVPVGMIMVCSGGSPLSQLMSKEAATLTGYDRYENGIPVSGLYNALMNPFIKMSVTGMIFYQGESENGLALTDYGKYNEYFKAYIDDLRAKNGDNFPVYYVQLSSHVTNDWKGTAEQRAVQFDFLEMMDNVGMVVSMDQGFRPESESDFAHPNNKKPVGDRLGDLALADHYGLLDEAKVTSPMPVTAVMDLDGNVVITFKNVASGLKRIGQHETLSGFKAITASGYKNVTATIIDANKVKLNTAEIEGVTGVGYGLELLAFADYPEGNGDLTYVANLGNSSDLPAPTFKMELASVITGANTVVDSTLNVNFFGTAKGEMKFEYNGNVHTVEGVYDEANGAYKYSFLGVNPQCMGDTITATLYVDGVKTDEKVNYSIKEYCDNIVKNGKPEGYSDDQYNALVTFMADMLDYGQAAQEYRGYKTEAPVNDLDWIEENKTAFTVPESVRDVTVSTNASYKFKSCGLHFANLVSVFVRLKVEDAANVTVEVSRDGQEAVIYTGSDLKNDILYLEGLSADEYDSVFVLDLKVNGETVQTLTYSANSYIAAKYQSDTIGSFIQTVGRYGASAEALQNAK